MRASSHQVAALGVPGGFTVPGLTGTFGHMTVEIVGASIEVYRQQNGVSWMKTADELRHEELARRAEEFRSASEDRDVERMLALLADDAEETMAPGTFRGKAAIRKLLEWEVRLSPVATSKDTGLGMVVVGQSVVWERQVSETAEGVAYTTDAVTILEFDDSGLIRRYRSYYDKLAVMEQIASGMSGVYGWFARTLVGYLVARGKKGLDTPSA